MGLLVEPIDPPDTQAWQISPTTADDVVAALTAAALLGYTSNVSTFVQPNTDPVSIVWSVELSRPGSPKAVAFAGDWIVCDGPHVRKLTNPEFIAEYTADVPLVWNAAAPVAEALPSDQVIVSFASPSSCNGPFTYTVDAYDFTENSTSVLNVVEQSVADGQVTLKGDGLITGHGYTFTATVGTPYEAEATSAPSESITAVI